MKKVFITLLFSIAVFTWNKATAQTKTKDGTVTGSSNFPDANAVLELESANKGLLLPRVALTALNAASPLGAHTAGMTVYNTATAGSGANAVTPGYYYNDGTKWVRINAEPWYNKATLAQATGNTDTIYTMGQVGIGTSSPQRQLHVSGTPAATAIGTTGFNLVAPTTRIEGLNATNNMAHVAADGTNSVKTVFTTSNGDLVTGNFHKVLAGNADLSSDIPTGKTISYTSGGAVRDTVTTRTFTLTQTSVVSIMYSVAVTEISQASGSRIEDGAPRMFRNCLEFSNVPAGSPVAAGAQTSHSTVVYVNHATSGNIVSGTFFNSSSLDVVLTAGTYRLALMGELYGAEKSVRGNFGGSSQNNRFSIIARPL